MGSLLGRISRPEATASNQAQSSTSFDAAESQAPLPTKHLPDWPMSLDEPTENQAFIPGEISIRGWSLDPLGPISIMVQVAGVPPVEIPFGMPSDDLVRTFPSEPNAKHSGFAGHIDISSLEPGEHELALIIKRASGVLTQLQRRIRILSNSDLARGAVKCFSDDCLRLQLDEPAENVPVQCDSVLRVSGWALAQSEVENIEVWLDGEGPRLATKGISREDVASLHSNFPQASRSGFVWMAPLYGIEPGRHMLRIRLTSKKHNLAEITTSFEIESNSDDELCCKASSLTKDQMLALYEASTEFTYQPRISLIAPVFRTSEASLRNCIAFVKGQAYPHWELLLVDDGSAGVRLTSFLRSLAEGDRRIKIFTLSSNRGIAGAINGALEECQGEFVGFLNHDELSPDAMFRVVETLNQDSSIDVLYSHEDKNNEHVRRRESLFRLECPPEPLRSINYACHFLVIRRVLLTTVGGLGSGFNGHGHDLILGLSAHTQKIRILPGAIHHGRMHMPSKAGAIDKKNNSGAGQRVLEQHYTSSARNRNDALRSVVEARISALRGELEAARRRSEELLSELASERAAVRVLRTQASELAHQKDGLPAVLDDALRSISGDATEPTRRIGVLPLVVLKQQLHSVIKLTWWAATFQLSKRLRGDGALTTPPATVSPEALSPAPQSEVDVTPTDSPTPSERFRIANPAWIEPRKRPEFFQLRSIIPRGRIAVVLHLYYADLWPELFESLLNIVEPFDLFVTLVAGISEDVAPTIRFAFPNAHILVVDNHGRDILPFLELIHTGVLFRYELICKLHSKRTTWRAGGDEWRQHLVRGVLGSPEIVEKILRTFDSDRDLAMVVADKQLFSGREFWVSNEPRLRQIFGKIGLNSSSFEKSFVGGSIYWIRPFVLRSVNAVGLDFDDFEPEPLAIDGTTAHAVERLISLVCHDAGMRIEETGNIEMALGPQLGNQPRVHLIANYLPQFHPIPENNLWWSAGFTEWTNVTRATPLFQDHRQPRLPADLGFYDLRLPEVRQAQADLARRYGVTAFSYYYYWFNGRRLLERPLDDVLASGKPDFPFMICWANEPWTRNWDGLSTEILVPQDYRLGWEERFAADIAPILRDPRYFHLNGEPVLAIYRVTHIPDAAKAMRRLRDCLNKVGIRKVHLIGGWLRIGGDEPLPEFPDELNLDAYFEFPPHGMPVQPMSVDPENRVPGFAGGIRDYNATVDAAIDQLTVGSEGFRYRGVMSGWDNTPRRGRNAFALHGATPTNFRRWLRAAVERARGEARDAETAVFINAWNEWAEGTYLEPDREFGHGWLEAVASVVKPAGRQQTADTVSLENDGHVRIRS